MMSILQKHSVDRFSSFLTCFGEGMSERISKENVVFLQSAKPDWYHHPDIDGCRLCQTRAS
jgi:hypothetical protein